MNSEALEDAIKAGKDAINKATTEADVQKALEAAKAAIDEIPTDAEMSDTFDAKKAEAVKALDTYVDATKYTKNSEELAQAIEQAKALVEAAKDDAELEAKVEEAHALIDAVKSDEQLSTELDEAIENAIAEIEKYENYMKASDGADTTYKSVLPEIATAKEAIENAETKEAVQEKLDEILAKIKATDGTIDEKLGALQEKKDAALQDLQAYENVLDEVEGLTEADKTGIKNIIKQAKAAVEAASSEEELTEAQTNFNALIGQYSNVAVEKARKEAIAKLEEHRDSTKPAMEKIIDDAIEAINGMDTASEISIKLTNVLNEIEPLEAAQEKAYAYLKEYEDYVKTASLEEAQKKLILGEIETVKGLIANASKPDEIADATNLTNNELEKVTTGAIGGFNAFMKSKYGTVVDGTEKQAANSKLQEAYKNAVTELSPYVSSSYADVKKVAKQAQESVDKVMPDLAEDASVEYITAAITKIDELLHGKGEKNEPVLPEKGTFNPENVTAEQLQKVETNFRGYIGNTEVKGVLKHMEETLAAQEIADKQACEDAKQDALEILDLYQKVLNDEEAIETLELTEEDIASIQEMLDATRSSVSAATKGSEVKKAMNLLRNSDEAAKGFLDTYYADYAKYASNYEFEHAQTAVLNKLEEYKETYKDDEDFLDKIEQAYDKVFAYKPGSNTVEQVNKELTDIENEIDVKNKSAELEAEKTRVINKYREVLTTSKEDTVKSTATQAISEIGALKYDGTPENSKTPADVKKLEEKYDALLKDALQKIEDAKQEAYRNALKKATDKVNEYIEIATAVGNQAVINQLNNYKELITSKTDEAGVIAAETELNSYIDESCKALKKQYDAIDTLLNTTYKNDAKDTEVMAKVNAAIEKIKALKQTDEDEMETAITDITTKLTADVKTIKDARSALEEEKTNAINAINEAMKDYKDDEATLETMVKEFKDSIKALTPDTDLETNKKSIQDYQQKAITAIENYIKAKLQSEVKAAVVSNTALNGTYKGKTIDKLVKEELVVSGNKSPFSFSAGTLLPVETQWTQFESSNNNTGYFVVLKVENKYAKTIEVTVEGGDATNKVVSDENGVYIVRVADLTDQDSQTVKAGLKLKVEYYQKEKNAQPADATVEYDLSAIKLQKNITKETIKSVANEIVNAFNSKTSDYATFSADNEKITCTATSNSKNMGEIRDSIGADLVSKLKAAADKIVKIKVGDNAAVTISSDDVSLTDLIAVIKAAMKAQSIETPSSTTTLNDLNGKTLTFTIVGTDGEEFTYNVEFKNQQ